MLKRLGTCALAAAMIVSPPAGAFAQNLGAPGAADPAAARREWGPVLKKLGIEEGKTATSERYNLLVQKLADLPVMAVKIRQSTRKPISLADWVHILTGLGIEPKPGMTEAEWAAILAQAGVDVSKGVSAPLTAQAAPPSVPPAAAAASTSTAAAVTVPPAAAPPAAKTISRTVTLDLKGMEINEVLKLIARQGDLNMVTASNVKGTVTLLLKDVELWEALHQVLETAELAYAYDGKIVRVMTAADYEKLYGVRFDDKTALDTITPKNVKAAAMSKYLEPFKSKIGKILIYDSSNALVLVDTPVAIARMKQMAASFDPQLETRVFTLNYAKAKELVPKILPLTTKDASSVEMDERTNRIIVMDYPDHIKSIETMISAFDEQHRAVLIEAKIVQVTLTDATQLGVNWGAVFAGIGRKGIPGGVTGNFSLFPIVAPGTPAGGAGTPGPGASGPTAFTAALGTLSQNNYTAIVQALQTVGKTKLISSPRISVINNETANLLVGTRQAYVTTTVVTPGTGATTSSEQVNFIDVGVKLHVTPTISEDGYITMKIKPEVSSVASTLTTAGGNSIPIVATSEVETSVLVKDGETLLLGGLIENDKSRTDTGVPLLSRIPLLGALFRSRSDSKTKSELAVFLTPHVNTGHALSEVEAIDGHPPTRLLTAPQ